MWVLAKLSFGPAERFVCYTAMRPNVNLLELIDPLINVLLI